MSRNRCQLLDLLGVKYFSRTSRLDRISKWDTLTAQLLRCLFQGGRRKGCAGRAWRGERLQWELKGRWKGAPEVDSQGTSRDKDSWVRLRIARRQGVILVRYSQDSGRWWLQRLPCLGHLGCSKWPPQQQGRGNKPGCNQCQRDFPLILA
jgi:hypothetical protein